MNSWILFAIAAAFLQNLRFLLQRNLAHGGMSSVGATFARFALSAPIVVLCAYLYFISLGVDVPRLNALFYGYAAFGGLSQILATICVVILFKLRNFAVGITLKKTETLLVVFVGMAILGDQVMALALGAIIIGILGVLFLSDPPAPNPETPLWARVFNASSGLGLLSGLFFALSAVSYRGATLAVDLPTPALKAAITLSIVGIIQLAMLSAYSAIFERGNFSQIKSHWRVILPLGLLSAAGSFCWFAAFAQANAAYVFAIGQIEVIFSLLTSYLVLRERPNKRELFGSALIVGSILILALALA